MTIVMTIHYTCESDLATKAKYAKNSPEVSSDLWVMKTLLNVDRLKAASPLASIIMPLNHRYEAAIFKVYEDLPRRELSFAGQARVRETPAPTSPWA